MIKINSTYILTPEDFRAAFDITAMAGAARKIALDRDVFPSSSRRRQKALLDLVDGATARVEGGRLITSEGHVIDLSHAESTADGPVETAAAVRMLLYELAGLPYSTAQAGVCEQICHQGKLPRVVVFDKGQSLTLPLLSAGAPSAPLEPVTLLNTSPSETATLLSPQGVEATVAPLTATVILTCGGALAAVVPGALAIDADGRMSLPGLGEPLEAGRLTQICPDPEGGFTALIDGCPVSYSVCVTPSDIEDLRLDPSRHGPVVEIATVGSHIVVLTATGTTLSNIPCPQGGLEGVTSVHTDSNYVIHALTSYSSSSSSPAL